jgi:hypothetical protein
LEATDSRYVNTGDSKPIAAFACTAEEFENGITNLIDLTPNLSFNKVIPWEAIGALAELSSLEHLNLQGCPVTAQGLGVLERCAGLRELVIEGGERVPEANLVFLARRWGPHR